MAQKELEGSIGFDEQVDVISTIPFLKIVLTKLELLRGHIADSDWVLAEEVFECLESLNQCKEDPDCSF